MHAIVATDGSLASLAAARQFKLIADSRRITDVTVVAVLSPLAAVPFANELGGRRSGADPVELSFREEAETALNVVTAEFDGWGPAVHAEIRSGSPAAEIVHAAKERDADLVVVASGSGGLTETILLGSTAQRVQHSAPCPVLVSRPTQRMPLP